MTLWPTMKILRARWFWGLVVIIAGVAALSALITQPIFSVPRASASPLVPPQRLQEHVKALTGIYSPRDWSHPENLDRAAQYIANEFSGAGGRVNEQKFLVDSRNYRNVIASFGPESSERIV